jgi:hypothetical protein
VFAVFVTNGGEREGGTFVNTCLRTPCSRCSEQCSAATDNQNADLTPVVMSESELFRSSDGTTGFRQLADFDP